MGDQGGEESGKDEKLFIDKKSLTSNMQGMEYIRNMMSIFIGSIAGIVGFTGTKGFILYGILYVLTSVGILLKMNFSPDKYIPKEGVLGFLVSGIGSQVVPFIMYWTLLYALVHLY